MISFPPFGRLVGGASLEARPCDVRFRASSAGEFFSIARHVARQELVLFDSGSALEFLASKDMASFGEKLVGLQARG